MSEVATKKTRPRYDRIARVYDLMELVVEMRFFKKYREETLGGLQGDVLEIGVGTGKNLPYCNKRVRVTAIDIGPRMAEKALSKNKLIALLEHIHNPLTRALLGFNVGRDTKDNIKKAGLTTEKDENLTFFDVFRELT